MIYVQINKRWYSTKFKHVDDITMMAYGHVELVYDNIARRSISRYEKYPPPDALDLEIWLQTPVSDWDEDLFNKCVRAMETSIKKWNGRVPRDMKWSKND